MLFYGTFSNSHLDGTGGDKYVVVEADDYDQARQIMFVRFGSRWAFLYNTPEGAGIEEWSLVCANPHGEPYTQANTSH